MGFFDFFRGKDESKYDLKFSDLIENEHKSIMLKNPILSSDFEKEFADLIISKPKEKGDVVSIKYYYTYIKIWEQRVEVFFEFEGVKTEGFIRKVNIQLNWLSKNKDFISNNISKDLLELKNENWVDKNQSIYNKESFFEYMNLNLISFKHDSSFLLTFEGFNLFEGHFIEVELNSKYQIKSINLVG